MRLILLALAFGVSFQTSAAVYYVNASSGSDSANGLTPATAWQTIGKVTNTWANGDTALLRRGETWSEILTVIRTNTVVDAYGPMSLPLPIIDGGNGTGRRWCVYVVGNLNTNRNLRLQNAGGLAAPNDTGAIWEGTVGTNSIEDCVLDRHLSDACLAGGASGGMIIVRRCTISRAFDDGFTLHGEATGLIEDSTISGCGQGINNSGTDMNLTVNRCVFTNNAVDVDALSVCETTFNYCRWDGRSDGTSWSLFKASETTTVFNYCIFNVSRSQAGLAGPSMTIEASTAFNNCVFYGGGFGSVVLQSGVTATATNCIFSQWWRMAFLNSGAALVSDHCIWNGITVSNATVTALVSTASPLFAGPAGGFFQLKSGSPAINAGTDIGLTHDIVGVPVGVPPTVGAYEFPSVTNLSSTLRINRR